MTTSCFVKANDDEGQVICTILATYERASSQFINFQKSSVFFSSNTVPAMKVRVLNLLGVSEGQEGTTYLGLPNMMGRNKSSALQFIKDQLRDRINTWHGKFLSRVGREVLLKTVAHALPTYTMNVCLFSLGFGQDLQTIMNKYWRHYNSTSK